jgi:predicted dehydrogenase
MSESKRVLIVGVGSIGLRHLRCFQNTGRTTMSFCEVNAALREKVAAEYQVERHFADLESALADPYDAAVICTPAHLHIPMATRLAEAGIHVLLEKPLSTSIQGIDNLREILTKRKLKSAVAYVMRANPVLREMRDAIVSGRFGRPLEVVAVCGQHFPTYRPAYRETYYTNRATGGGAIQDALTHILNAAEWMVGPIDRLVVDAAHQRLEGVEVEDTAHVIARHGSVLASYTLNQHQAPTEITISVICDGGTARFEYHQNRWRWMVEPDTPWHDEQHEPIVRDAFFVTQANAFLDLLEDRAPPLCTLDEGLQTLRVNLAALASADQRAWQTIDRKPA